MVKYCYTYLVLFQKNCLITKLFIFPQIKVNLKGANAADHGDSNTMVLPSQKRKTKKLHYDSKIKIISKKGRKRLEKIVATKEKKSQVII